MLWANLNSTKYLSISETRLLTTISDRREDTSIIMPKGCQAKSTIIVAKLIVAKPRATK